MINAFSIIDLRGDEMFFKTIQSFILDEEGSYSVELSLLFPIIVIIAMFFIDNNLYYDGLIMTATSTNEALRYAITSENEGDAINQIKNTLGDRLKQAKLGWCSSEGSAHCSQWKNATHMTSSVSSFNGNDNFNLLVNVSDSGWCNGSYLTIGVRTHKASLIPSFSTFRRLVTRGGSIYHEYTYIFKARIESNHLCS